MLLQHLVLPVGPLELERPAHLHPDGNVGGARRKCPARVVEVGSISWALRLSPNPEHRAGPNPRNLTWVDKTLLLLLP